MPTSREAELLAADRFAASLGISLLDVGPDRVAVGMELAAHHLDGGGRVRRWVSFAIADCAMSLISNAATRAFAVSAHLVGEGTATSGDHLVATAVPIHHSPGRVTWSVTVAAGEQPIATFTGTTLEVPG